jgi:soluble epoxide hydrolase / lipid-phosphate phosphatase
MQYHTLLWALASAVLLRSTSLASPVPSGTTIDSGLDSFTTADGARYAYVYTPAQGENSTFLILHGYPSTHRDWQAQIDGLTAEGFGVLVPDMLGFGASDMPTDPAAYKQKRLARHMKELLDHEGLRKVIGVGHDWGAVVLSRFALYHQNRLEKTAWVNVGYQAPGGFVDLDAINALIDEQDGYMPYAYWYFNTRYDAADVIRDHVSSLSNQSFTLY